MKKLAIAMMLGIAAMSASAQVNYKMQVACSPQDVKTYDTNRLRSSFLMEKVMVPNEINVTYSMYDRLIFGGAVPATKELVLETIDPLKSKFFLERRELGVIKMGAVMELIPRITSLFIEGLKPISDATRELIAKKYKNNTGLSIGMSPALVIGHPTTLVVSLLLIPVTIFLAVILPGNRFLPLASLAGMFYLFPMILPITKGNVVKSFIIGLVALTVGLYFVTGLAGFFTLAAKDVYAATGDPTVNIPAGFEGGALDFASSLFCWGIFHLTYSLKIIGPAILVALALGMAIYNRIRMTRNDAKNALNSNKE